MPADLTNIYDHPVSVLNAAPEHGYGEHADFEKAVEVLRAHEAENNVTFVALDNVTLAAVNEAYEAGESATGLVDVSTAHSVLRSVVRDLLGLDD